MADKNYKIVPLENCDFESSYLYQHYLEFLGTPNRVFVFTNLPANCPSPLFVLEIAPLSEEHFWTYISLGGSGTPVVNPENDQLLRIEVFMYSNNPNEQIVEFIAGLATYPFRFDAFLNWNHLWDSSAKDGVIADSPLSAGVFVPPFTEAKGFGVLEGIDKSHLHILWFIPLYTSERLFAKKHGINELIKLLFESKAEIANLWRTPAITQTDE